MMAYMEFAGHRGAALSAPVLPPARPHPDEAHDLSRREWTIVRLAREDGLSSLREEGRLGRFVRMIFGIERKNPLSNDRLEALRRIAVLSWHHGYNVAPSEIGDFLSSGYSEPQYEQLTRRIAAERAASRTRMA
jgi:hypothetical protein